MFVTDKSSVTDVNVETFEGDLEFELSDGINQGSDEEEKVAQVVENYKDALPESEVTVAVKKNWVSHRVSLMSTSYSDWLRLQHEIRAFPDKVRERMKEIQHNFALYRLTITGLSYKAPRIEEEIWETYNQITGSIPHLEQLNQKRPLFLHTNPKLRELHQAWTDLYAQQTYLCTLLSKAPKGLEFFNRMQIVREQKRQEELRHQENQVHIETAYESLKKALSYVEHQCKDDEPIFYGNEIITLQDAQHFWNETLTEILTLRDLNSASVETVLERMHALEEMIRDYPSISKQIQRVGERYSRLIAYHDLLSSYGKRIIPQAEIARASAIMYEQIPALWSAGQYANLKIFLERVENFLNFYENTVELEVAIGERRRSGFTQGLSPSIVPGVSGLSPLIGLARVLVAAIDQRDRFMVGHSESVARLALKTGRKLNWSGADLEFLEIAALLHDIGKISIPETILTKVKPLTSQEWKMIQMHPYYGAQIVKQMSIFNRIVPWIYHHQEHWDGSGYPDQLSKKDIPAASSIISIAEAYTVMTSELPYRKSVTTREALDSIEEASGKQFDPAMVEALLKG
jgi:putative nucleotidyltransferase with HDIG domain